MDSYLVIGGEGMVGHAILELLHKRYSTTVPNLCLYSSSRTRRFHDPRWSFIRSDLTSSDSLRAVLEETGAGTVFLAAASHFESTREVAFEVNVRGTEAVIEACLSLSARRAESPVRRLILTSSTSIVFNGRDVVDVTEDEIPYFDKESDYKSYYAASKAEAEKLVLAANGRNGTLFTCAIRPSAMVGFADTAVLPQMVGILHKHQAFVQIGDNTNLCDFDHVDNVAYGHVLACEKLLVPASATTTTTTTAAARPPSESNPPVDNGDSATTVQQITSPPSSSQPPPPPPPFPSEYLPGPAAGQVFNITTGEPVPMFTFLRKVWYEYNGYSPWFTLVLPLWLTWWIACINEWICGLFGQKALGINRDTIVYAVATRTHNIDKARRLLDYTPIVGLDEGIKRAVADYKEEERKLQEQNRRRAPEAKKIQ